MGILSNFINSLRKAQPNAEISQSKESISQIEETKIEDERIQETQLGESEIQTDLEAKPLDNRPKNIEGFPYEEFSGCRSNTRLKMIDRTAYPGQVYQWMLDCSCGFQARLTHKNDALIHGEKHTNRRLESGT